MMFCDNCGAQLRDGAQFCPKCGKPVPIDEDKTNTEDRRTDAEYRVTEPEYKSFSNKKDETKADRKRSKSGGPKAFVIMIAALGALGVLGMVIMIILLNSETKKNEYQMDVHLVKCGGVVYYVDKNGLWKKEPDSDSVLLAEGSAMNLATDGEVIYYGVFSNIIQYNPYGKYTIDVRQYDMYRYDLKTGANEMITKFKEAGQPICAIDDTVYYTDYSDSFDGNMAGLAQGIWSYNLSTGVKRYITGGAQIVRSYGTKIFYREMMAAGAGFGVHQIHCYDVNTGKSEIISEDCVMSFEVISGKLYYMIGDYFRTDIHKTKICCYDISTGVTKVLFESDEKTLSVRDFDDKYAILAMDSGYYRFDLTSGEKAMIPSDSFDGLVPDTVWRCQDKTVFFTGKGSKRMYTVKDDSTEVLTDKDSITCMWIVAIVDDTVFYNQSAENNVYLCDVGYRKCD